MVENVKDPRDKRILIYFIMFFSFIAIMDSIFVYIAISTQTGVVTEHPYEKGLAFNKVLAKARSQPLLNQTASYKGSRLRWYLADSDNLPLTDVIVTAKIIRPVQDGYDHDISLNNKGGGIYEVYMNLPLRGKWQAKLSGKWDSKQYQTTLDFIAK